MKKLVKKWGTGVLWLLMVSVLFPKVVFAAPSFQDFYDQQGVYYYDPDANSDKLDSKHDERANDGGRGDTSWEDDIPSLPPVDDNILAPEPQPLPDKDRSKFDYRHIFFGDAVRVADDTMYYASADLNGSGARDRFDSDNPYTSSSPCFYIGGFALVTADGQLQEYECYLGDQIDELQLAPQFCVEATDEQKIWLHLYTAATKDCGLGWIPASAARPAISQYVEPLESVTAAELYGCFSQEQEKEQEKEYEDEGQYWEYDEQRLLDPVCP